MKIVIGGRFDYMRVAWKKAYDKHKVIYFDGDSLLSATLIDKTRRRLAELLYNINIISEKKHNEFLRMDNLRELFEVDALNPHEKILFIIYEMNVLSTDFESIKLLKRKYKKAKFVLFFTNVIGSVRPGITESLLDHRELYDLIYTFNPSDAEKYNLNVYSGGVFPYDPPDMIKDVNYSSDVVWIGKNKNRFHVLNEISKSLTLQGIKTRFIVANEKEEKSTQYVTVISDRIPYSEYLKYIYNSKCLLDIEKDGGGTLRLTEIIAYKKALMTNNKSIINVPLFNSNQIYVFDNTENIKESFLSLIEGDRMSPELVSTEIFLKDIKKRLWS